MNMTMTFEQFCSHYDNEETCSQALFSARWPDGFICPRCSHRQYYCIRSRKLPLYECRSCGAQTSIRSGTIMEGSRTPLKLWFQAIFLHAAPQGISALRLASIIGTTYKTAWLICHKIRYAMSTAGSSELLTGLVRINCGVYGRPYNPTIYRHPQEQPLLIGGTIDNDRITHIKIKQVPDHHLIYDRITSEASHDFVKTLLHSATTDITIVIHKFSRHRYKPLIQLCNSATGWINNTFNGIGPKHLQSYLDQFCFGFNYANRNADPFENLLRHSAVFPTLTYPALIRREDRSLQRKRNYSEQLKSVS
ncbi:transposase [Cohnella herbarum]|uniref:Transposase n=1 Tax=Cohnella herbarum TaxID=2728023 RepID=A0A7Z2VP79_9BACL|nr:transposase [Cohnella herbarum]QJD86445.1 transposase [Cohnella herbarum]